MKIVLVFVALSVLIAGSWAAPADPYAPYAPYAPAPAPYHEEKIPPEPFVYEYGHVDPSGLGSAKTESQDADGVVRGEYRVQLPDGRIQIVTYQADHVNGYVADVKYEGVAKEYAPEPYQPAPVRNFPVHAHAPYARQ